MKIVVLTILDNSIRNIATFLLYRFINETQAQLQFASNFVSMKRELGEDADLLLVYGKGDEPMLVECARKAVVLNVCPVVFLHTSPYAPDVQGIALMYYQAGITKQTPDDLYRELLKIIAIK